MNEPQPETNVIDASVAMKWLLPDEDFTHEALSILLALQDGDLALVAPNHLYFEVANVLRTAILRDRLTDAEAREALAGCLALPIAAYSDRELVIQGFDMAVDFGCAAYDGLYLAVAAELDCPLIHADERLRNTLGGRFDQELWIGDLEFPSTS